MPADLPTKSASHSSRRDDIAYTAPMLAFLAFTYIGGKWPGLLVASWILKTLIPALLIAFFWKHYTRIRWSHAWLGILVGVIGIVQWIGVEELLLHYWPNYPRIPAATDPFDPHTAFASPLAMWLFVMLRWACAALVVPFVEELFWRDFLWRSVIAPNDFKLADVGEWDPNAVLFVTAIFATVHPQWVTAIIWGLLIAALLLRTRSLGACIIAHGVSNLLLGLYVLQTGKWYYW